MSAGLGARPRRADARQLGVFPGPRGADAPERISNDFCSLVPGEPRGALAVRMVIGSDGRKRSHSFHRILMRSAAKLNYAQAQAAIDGRPDDTTGPLLGPILKPLYEAYAIVSARATNAIRSISTSRAQDPAEA